MKAVEEFCAKLLLLMSSPSDGATKDVLRRTRGRSVSPISAPPSSASLQKAAAPLVEEFESELKLFKNRLNRISDSLESMIPRPSRPSSAEPAARSRAGGGATSRSAPGRRAAGDSGHRVVATPRPLSARPARSGQQPWAFHPETRRFTTPARSKGSASASRRPHPFGGKPLTPAAASAARASPMNRQTTAKSSTTRDRPRPPSAEARATVGPTTLGSPRREQRDLPRPRIVAGKNETAALGSDFGNVSPSFSGIGGGPRSRRQPADPTRYIQQLLTAVGPTQDVGGSGSPSGPPGSSSAGLNDPSPPRQNGSFSEDSCAYQALPVPLLAGPPLLGAGGSTTGDLSKEGRGTNWELGCGDEGCDRRVRGEGVIVLESEKVPGEWNTRRFVARGTGTVAMTIRDDRLSVA